MYFWVRQWLATVLLLFRFYYGGEGRCCLFKIGTFYFGTCLGGAWPSLWQVDIQPLNYQHSLAVSLLHKSCTENYGKSWLFPLRYKYSVWKPLKCLISILFCKNDYLLYSNFCLKLNLYLRQGRTLWSMSSCWSQVHFTIPSLFAYLLDSSTFWTILFRHFLLIFWTLYWTF